MGKAHLECWQVCDGVVCACLQWIGLIGFVYVKKVRRPVPFTVQVEDSSQALYQL